MVLLLVVVAGGEAWGGVPLPQALAQPPASPSSALRRCLDFIGSFVRTRRRISGAKFGIPANCTLPDSDSASPTRSWPHV